MQERHSDRERYFDEQARTTEKYYIPYIRKCCPELPQEVLEVGCGEGGNLFSFAQLGCSVTGVDIAAGRIAEARKFFAERGAEGTFIASDIFKLTELEHKILPDIGARCDRAYRRQGRFPERAETLSCAGRRGVYGLSCMANAFRRAPANSAQQSGVSFSVPSSSAFSAL